MVIFMTMSTGNAQKMKEDILQGLGKSPDFVGLAVCSSGYFFMDNIKYFHIIDPIVTPTKGGSDKIILVAGTYGGDERDNLDNVSIGDTLLMQAYYRESPLKFKVGYITIIEDQPIFYLPPNTWGSLRYKQGMCYYHYEGQRNIRYTEIKKLIIEKINKTE